MAARRVLPTVLLVCGAVLSGDHAARSASEAPPLTVEPARVGIGLFYSGVDLTVSAQTEPGCDVVVVVSGPSSELVLRKQERRWGMFWAPGGEVVFDDVPALYLIQATVEPDTLAPAHLLEELGVGYASLSARLGGQTRGELVRELIALREDEGLYASTVRDHPGDAGEETGPFLSRTVVHIPAQAPPGVYSARLCAFRDGQLVSRADGSFEIEQAGLVWFVSSLASSHGLAYGVVAVVVAVTAGLLVGFLFGSTRKRT